MPELLQPSWSVLAVAIAIDLVFGDPPNALHPVAWLGRVARWLQTKSPTEGRAVPFVSGVALVGITVCMALVATVAMLRVAERVHPFLHFAVAVFLTKSTFALRGLVDAAHALVRAHDEGGLSAARARLSWLCSRDPSDLDAEGLANGTIESLAENLSDSVVAPLLAYVAFGLPGAVVYRTLNTLDAMVGYRGTLEWLGKPAARLDDLANLVPARLTAVLLAIAGLVLRLPLASGFTTYARDRNNTESPNAGHPMSMASGLLERRLDKPGVYVLGAGFAPPALDDVARAARLVGFAGALAFLAAVIGATARG